MRVFLSLDLNANYGRDITGQSNTSVGPNYCCSLNENFDFTISGEKSDGSFTLTLMVTEKSTGISFGIEYKLTGNFFKLENHKFNFVIKASIGGKEIIFKFCFAKVAGAIAVAGKVIASVCTGNGSSDSDNDSGDSDKSVCYSVTHFLDIKFFVFMAAAKAARDSIHIDVDLALL
uniref:Uncharacterized protein n=1 Tax=Panagrolaimus sp. PS1159 TaxID=55785 RepID=A0AC35ESP2_9BILA